MENITGQAGAIALVGSGEYLDAMNTTDRYLLDTLGGPAQARVVVIPTASGLEEGMPTRWNALGVEHFRALGASVEPVMLVERADTTDGAILATLEKANFFYFSGGNPAHLIQTLADSPAWEIIRRAHLNGAVLAGCSAGAMALGGYTISLRSLQGGNTPAWVPGLGLVRGLVTFPHFDRMSGFVGPDIFKAIIASALNTLSTKPTLLGVDENTALVRLHPTPNPSEPITQWQVMGQQTVSVFDEEGQAQVYQTGQKLGLLES